MRSANRTAADAIDTVLAPMSVSERTGFGDRERALKKLVEQQAERAGLLRGAHGVLELAEDLRLAQHHGIEPARHAERVLDRVLARQLIHVRIEVLRFSADGNRRASAAPAAARRYRSRFQCGCTWR
jgi:hypothetical protein